ncbi:hypothetical protein PUN28_000790 [Cardiocondyla obscurior]|uniref:Uncharacterized protein n=1 Tax=Cardiocondyla obscurior TaxID=286306 RepID=A0AAW2H1F9_9HYME
MLYLGRLCRLRWISRFSLTENPDQSIHVNTFLYRAELFAIFPINKPIRRILVPANKFQVISIDNSRCHALIHNFQFTKILSECNKKFEVMSIQEYALLVFFFFLFLLFVSICFSGSVLISCATLAPHLLE